MFKSYWVIAVAFGLATIGAAWFSWAEFSTYQENQTNERIDAAQYHADTSQHGPSSCRTVMDERGVFQWLACLADSVSTDGGYKQATYDLKAQQDMATWALGMLIVTAWLTVITLLGVLFVWRTFKETAAGVLVMRNEQRPWLSIDIKREARLSLIAGEHYMIGLNSEIKNHGKTVADRIQYLFELDYKEIGSKIIEGKLTRTSDAKDVIFPDQTASGINSVMDTFTSIPADPHTIILRVKVEYRSPGMSDEETPFETIASREVFTAGGGNVIHPDTFANAGDEGDAESINIFLSNEYGHQSKVT